MDKSKKHYWAVFCDARIDYEGSFTECWKWLVEQYHDKTLGELHAARIRVARQS